jgi:hypothetical protein
VLLECGAVLGLLLAGFLEVGSSAVATSCLWFFGVIRSLLLLISFVFVKLIFSCLARGGII